MGDKTELEGAKALKSTVPLAKTRGVENPIFRMMGKLRVLSRTTGRL